MPIKKRMTGFTLAEVLIVLAIIGVVAALCILALMSKVEKHEEYVGYKKALSTISDAAARIREDNGGSMIDINSASNAFKPYLKVISYYYTACVKSVDGVCHPQGSNSSSDLSYPINGSIKLITADGIVYMFPDDYLRGAFGTASNCKGNAYSNNGEDLACMIIFVDVNGNKNPNTIGKDILAISVNKYNVTPYRRMAQDLTATSDCPTPLSKGSHETFAGISCGYRAMTEGGIYYY